MAWFWERLSSDNWAIRAGLPTSTYQVQVFVEGEAPLSTEERKQARDFFMHVGRLLTKDRVAGSRENRS